MVPFVLVVDHNPPHLQVFIVSAGVGYGSLEVAVVDVADCSEHGLFDSAPADVCPEGVVLVRCIRYVGFREDGLDVAPSSSPDMHVLRFIVVSDDA